MFRARLRVHRHAPGEDRLLLAAVTLCRAHELEISVLVFVVVPAHEAQHPLSRLVEAREGAGAFRAVLAGAEQALGVGVVVGGARAAVRGGNRQSPSLLRKWHMIQ